MGARPPPGLSVLPPSFVLEASPFSFPFLLACMRSTPTLALSSLACSIVILTKTPRGVRGGWGGEKRTKRGAPPRKDSPSIVANHNTPRDEGFSSTFFPEIVQGTNKHSVPVDRTKKKQLPRFSLSRVEEAFQVTVMNIESTIRRRQRRRIRVRQSSLVFENASAILSLEMNICIMPYYTALVVKDNNLQLPLLCRRRL